MVAIKDMIMPTDCCECGAYIYIKHGPHTTKNICCIANKKIYVEHTTSGRPDFCPLVELEKNEDGLDIWYTDPADYEQGYLN